MGLQFALENHLHSLGGAFGGEIFEALPNGMAGHEARGNEEDEFGNEEDEPGANDHEEECADSGLRGSFGFERDPHSDVRQREEESAEGENGHAVDIKEGPACVACVWAKISSGHGGHHWAKNPQVERRHERDEQDRARDDEDAAKNGEVAFDDVLNSERGREPEFDFAALTSAGEGERGGSREEESENDEH